MTVLLGAEQVARAADLEIAQRELEPGAQLGELLEHPEAMLGLPVHAPVGGDQQVRVGLLPLAPDPPA